MLEKRMAVYVPNKIQWREVGIELVMLEKRKAVYVPNKIQWREVGIELVMLEKRMAVYVPKVTRRKNSYQLQFVLILFRDRAME